MDIAASFAIEQPAVICSLDNKIMKQIFIIGLIFAAFTCASLAAGLDTAKIDNLTGLKGKLNEKEGVYKVTFPRDDAGRGRRSPRPVHPRATAVQSAPQRPALRKTAASDVQP